MKEKIKVSDDIEKTSKLPVPLIVFLVIFTLTILLIFYLGPVKTHTLNAGVILIFGLFFLFVIGFAYWIYKTMKSSKNMKKHIEDGTIITKKAEIVKISYYYHSDRDFGREEGYYVVATNGTDTYRSKLFERAALTGGFSSQSIDKEFLQKNGIPYSPRDPKYDKEAVIKRIRKIDEEIDILNEQGKTMSFFEKIKNKSKVGKLNMEKDRLFPPSLICGGKNLYIGDEVTVLIDPDNPKNYEMQI